MVGIGMTECFIVVDIRASPCCLHARRSEEGHWNNERVSPDDQNAGQAAGTALATEGSQLYGHTWFPYHFVTLDSRQKKITVRLRWPYEIDGALSLKSRVKL